ncbi:MAG: HAD family hydrolase [Pseudohongiellaceae bacterium]
MSLAVFDLDNTLLAGDSDHAWGDFLILHGLADAKKHAAANDEFYRHYTEGKLDINAYVRFTLGPVLHMQISALQQLHTKFMQEFIRPLILPAAKELITGHLAQGDYCLIMSATNGFITAPIASEFGVHELLATDLEIEKGFYTGSIVGVPCFQSGKVIRLEQWLRRQQDRFSLADTVFYSDSYNDVPLLEAVGTPVAVDPDAKLSALARQRNWRVISLREG